MLLAIAALVAIPAPASASPATEIKQAFSQLSRQTGQLPSSGERRILLSLASAASRQRSRPCTAFALMKRYKSQLAKLRRTAPKAGRKRETDKRARPAATKGMLEAASLAVDAALLSHPNARGCGGAKTPPSDGQAKARLLESNERGMTMRVSLPQARFAFHRYGNRDWAELVMEGMRPQEGVGKPGLPSILEQFGIPNGANLSARAFNVSGYTLNGVNLLPQQEEPVDQNPADPNRDRPPEEVFFDKRFAIDSKQYRSRSTFPAAVGGALPIGQLRDISAGGAKAMGAQYRPALKRLRVITSVDIRIDFGGENRGTFGDARLLDPFNATFQRIYRQFLNWDDIRVRPGTDFPPIDFCGEEVLIVTSSALRPAANTLRTQKNAEGFLTRIVETGAGAGQIGTTHTQIQSFIRGELTSDCWVRPSYVILIGDTSHVATWIVGCGPGTDPADENCHGGTGIASDHPYSMKDDADFLADTAVGRISANTLDQANTVVGKIVQYETTAPAPAGDDFYRHITNTAYFEPTYICELNEGQSGTPDCDPEGGSNASWVFHPEITQDARGFSKTAEDIRSAMTARGYSVDRLYFAHSANDPQTYHDGTPMPAAIKKPGFPWDADTTDFLDAFNDGRTIVFHRDHGWPHGWGHPDLSTGNVPAMTNGAQLPVVFGINCSSARYDVPGDPSMVESLLLHPTGGSVGGFGDTRVSGTWANNSISFGFFDALFPNVNEGYGSDTPLQRMGDVLVSGKNYLATHHAGALYGHSMLYGYFGDPTMQLWIAPPVTFDPDRFKGTIFRENFPFPKPPGPGPDPPPYYVLAEFSQPEAEGTLVTLVQKAGQGQEEQTIGRGVVENGRAVIYPLVRQRTTANMEIRLQNQGMLAAAEAVQGK